MTTRRVFTLMMLVTAVLLVAGCTITTSQQAAPTVTIPPPTKPPPTDTPRPTDTPTPPPTEQMTDTVDLYFVALEDAGQSGDEIGCEDSVVPVEWSIEPTTEPLPVALRALLDVGAELVTGDDYYNALHQSRLALADWELVDGVAIVNLVGDANPGGACDTPRLIAQLEHTVTQFDAVDQAEIYLNDQPLEEALSLRGEPEEAADEGQSVNLYVIALEDGGQSGEEIGCGDSVVPIEHQLPPGDTPIADTLTQLLNLNQEYVGEEDQYYNALYQSQLEVASVTVEDGVAYVSLSGVVLMGGACDLPRYQAQIERTITQFDNVDRAEVEINGTPLSVVTGTADRATPDPREMMTINLYFIALEDGGQRGREIGCGDSVVGQPVEIEPTDNEIMVALAMLFEVDTQYYENTDLYNALAESRMTVSSVTVEHGVAFVQLSGEFTIPGTCDVPRIKAQIEETILQFDEVEEVDIRVYGQPLDEVLDAR